MELDYEDLERNGVEVWRDVVGFEGFYEVSTLGRIRRYGNKRIRKPSMSPKYPHILLSVSGVHNTYRVHRIVAKAFRDLVLGKDHVNHKNGITKDFRASNLEWSTQQENNHHAYYELGRVSPMLSAERLPFQMPGSIVSIEDVLKFKDLNDSGVPTEIIGKEFNVDGSTVRSHLRKLRCGKYDSIIQKPCSSIKQ